MCSDTQRRGDMGNGVGYINLELRNGQCQITGWDRSHASPAMRKTIQKPVTGLSSAREVKVLCS